MPQRKREDIEKDIADAEVAGEHLDKMLAETDGWDAVDEAKKQAFIEGASSDAEPS